MKQNDQRLIIGIDLGNTNTSLAYRKGDGKPCLLAIDDDPEKPNSLRNVLRSAVLFPFNAAQEPIVGRRALELAHESGWLFKDYKKSLLDGATDESHYQGLRKGSLDALVEILRDLRRRLSVAEPEYFIQLEEQNSQQEFVPALPPFVTLGVPSETLDTYKSLLEDALIKSSWYSSATQAEPFISFLPEPVAPLLLITPNPDKTYLVFDIGGQTLDLALARVSTNSAYQYEIIRTERCTYNESDIGGRLLDRLIMRKFAEDEDTWMELLGGAEEYYGISADPDELRRMSRGEIDWVNDGTPEGEFYKFLAVDLENFRIALSEKSKAKLILNSSSSSTISRKPISDELNRDDYDNDILEKVLQPIEASLNSILVDERGNSITKDAIIIITAGGVSLTPGIAAYLNLSYGKHNVRSPHDYSPLETIAVGCAKFTPAGLVEKNPVQINPRTDTDYAVWDAGYERWSIVVPQGTEYEKTRLPVDLPKSGVGIFQTYRLTHKSSTLQIKVGQRSKSDGKWTILGERNVRLSENVDDFQVYFEIDPQQGILEMCLIHKGYRIPMTDPKFKTPR